MKTMLVTGASSGIGYATALQAVEQGFTVYACGRNQERLDELARHSDNIKTLAFDLTDLQACKLVLGNLNVDVVVVNAGTCEYIDIEKWDSEAFHRVFDVNYFSVVYCLEALLPNLQSGAQLVFIDSLARMLPFTRSQAYGASKAALFYLAKTLDVDLRDRGITVQTLSPGFVATPLTAKNTFSMPMQITAEEAGASVVKAINRKVKTGYFPMCFSAIIRLLSATPYTLQSWLCSAMKRKAA